jgi:hypothetical protein
MTTALDPLFLAGRGYVTASGAKTDPLLSAETRGVATPYFRRTGRLKKSANDTFSLPPIYTPGVICRPLDFEPTISV